MYVNENEKMKRIKQNKENKLLQVTECIISPGLLHTRIVTVVLVEQK